MDADSRSAHWIQNECALDAYLGVRTGSPSPKTRLQGFPGAIGGSVVTPHKHSLATRASTLDHDDSTIQDRALNPAFAECAKTGLLRKLSFRASPNHVTTVCQTCVLSDQLCPIAGVRAHRHSLSNLAALLALQRPATGFRVATASARSVTQCQQL